MKLDTLTTKHWIDEDSLLKTAFFQKIINEDQQVQNWRGPFSAQQFKEVFLLLEAKNVAKDDVKKSEPTFLYTKSAERSLGELPPSVAGRITARLSDFVDHKKGSPLTPFGARDRVFADDHLRGFKHAHLTHDWSLIYKYDGQKNQFCIYGVFTHDQIGTGSPPNDRKIKRNADSWKAQAC